MGGGGRRGEGHSFQSSADRRGAYSRGTANSRIDGRHGMSLSFSLATFEFKIKQF